MNSTITLIKTIDRPIRKHKKVDLSASCLLFFCRYTENHTEIP